MILPDAILQSIIEHAKSTFPKECCGVIVNNTYLKCRNIADVDSHFIMHPEDYALAEDFGTIAAIVHSHPNMPAIASDVDKIGCNNSNLPWVIISYPSCKYNTIYPDSYTAPLIGREYSYGIFDCYTLVKDYYSSVLNINLDYFSTEYKWWEKGINMYINNAESQNFIPVSTPCKHDILLLTIGKNRVPSHAAIWLDNGYILHHPFGSVSRRELYTDKHRNVTSHIFRHKELV